MAAIHLQRISKTYPNGHVAIRHVDVTIADGEFLVLVGPSGCGKSTLLRLIGGLEEPSAGQIVIGDRDVTTDPPAARDIAMVFQSYALYPHMTVRDNLGYGLKVRGTPRDEAAARVSSVAQALGLDGLLDRRPAQLSGGQRQRVALGRAMVRQPQAFLLDEPLSNLDPALRAQARAEIARLYRTSGTTVVYVTHDQEEAMTLGGRIAVMRDGIIEQIAPPLAVYSRPANTFVARFIGAPPMNLVPAAVFAPETPAGVTAGVRPQDLTISESDGAVAQVELVEPRGHDTIVHLRLESYPESPVLALVTGAAPGVGTRVHVAPADGAVHYFDGSSGQRMKMTQVPGAKRTEVAGAKRTEVPGAKRTEVPEAKSTEVPEATGSQTGER